MKQFLRNNSFFLLPYAFFALVGLYLSISLGKTELHLRVNSFVGIGWRDTFFTYITHLGDGLFTLLVFLVLLFINLKNAMQLILSYSLSALITQGLKHFVFHDVYRPFHYFRWEDPHTIKFVENVPGLIAHSFPSGHATAAICLAFCLAIFINNHYAKVLLLLLGVFVAFSRVYLSQHFTQDILAGSFIAIVCVILIYAIINFTQPFKKLRSSDKNIIDYFKK